ncbi:MAG: hypothetical protein Q7J70_02465 [Thermodesulfovibrionales bacterium]|nr:hypothetical protein [Thermodesulfovibrionales bacterium]
MEEQKGIGVDLSIASQEMIEALISESGEPSLFEEGLKTNTWRHDILRLLAESPYTPENIREETTRILQIPVAVVSNPKTPAGVAVPLLYGLKIKDLASLEKNRNIIEEVIRTTAKNWLGKKRALSRRAIDF